MNIINVNQTNISIALVVDELECTCLLVQKKIKKIMELVTGVGEKVYKYQYILCHGSCTVLPFRVLKFSFN